MDWFSSEDPAVPVVPDAPMSVSEVSAVIAALLDDPSLQDIRVRGEVTNYTHHSRGHRYFSLSEKGGGSTAAVIRCVMWRSDAQRLSFSPEEGMEVIITGSVRHYAPHGAYQLQVDSMARAGVGEKYLLVERWKADLAAEGAFAAETKRPLPQFPVRVGVVTSETGAVIHDIRTVISRRYPLEIVLSPTAVQGEEAHGEIARALQRVGSLADVVIVARGGGSFEDLFPFNHPDVVRAIRACPVPVVSAIGHEVDVTLADLAADVRAATPSAAAELVVPDRGTLLEGLLEIRQRIRSLMQNRIGAEAEQVAGLRDRLRPLRYARKIGERKQYVADLAERLYRSSAARTEHERLLLDAMKSALTAHNPLAVLQRGYCVAEKDGRVVKSVGEIAAGDRVTVRFRDGSSRMNVESVNHDRNV
jgi:exodeoxyribonuclease VII large subunit